MCKAQHRCSRCVCACARACLHFAFVCTCLNMLSLFYITELQHTIESICFCLFLTFSSFFLSLPEELCSVNPRLGFFFWLSVNVVLAPTASDKQTCTWINHVWKSWLGFSHISVFPQPAMRQLVMESPLQ